MVDLPWMASSNFDNNYDLFYGERNMQMVLQMEQIDIVWK